MSRDDVLKKESSAPSGDRGNEVMSGLASTWALPILSLNRGSCKESMSGVPLEALKAGSAAMGHLFGGATTLAMTRALMSKACQCCTRSPIILAPHQSHSDITRHAIGKINNFGSQFVAFVTEMPFPELVDFSWDTRQRI